MRLNGKGVITIQVVILQGFTGVGNKGANLDLDLLRFGVQRKFMALRAFSVLSIWFSMSLRLGTLSMVGSGVAGSQSKLTLREAAAPQELLDLGMT